MAKPQRQAALQVSFKCNAQFSFHVMLHNTIPTDALLLIEILLRWPRLPVETSLPLDFGATPINESKVGSSYDF